MNAGAVDELLLSWPVQIAVDLGAEHLQEIYETCRDADLDRLPPGLDRKLQLGFLKAADIGQSRRCGVQRA